ncbi:MAG: AbrB/MazE/SpoVT family DNA-binding domain-containing protein [Candidatus Nanohaloarchaea archaeon]
MATITSPEGEGAQAGTFQEKTVKTSSLNSSFSATIDSKGRVTVPSELRDRFGLEPGDQVSLEISGELFRVDADREKALEIVEELGVEEFRYSDGTLEVVR